MVFLGHNELFAFVNMALTWMINLWYFPFLDGVSKRSMNESQMLIHRPQATKGASPGGTTTHHVNGRPRSGKKLFYKTNVDKNKKDRINVNARPYSASSVSSDKSPYSQKIVGQPRRVRSGRKSKGY